MKRGEQAAYSLKYCFLNYLKVAIGGREISGDKADSHGDLPILEHTRYHRSKTLKAPLVFLFRDRGQNSRLSLSTKSLWKIGCYIGWCLLPKGNITPSLGAPSPRENHRGSKLRARMMSFRKSFRRADARRYQFPQMKSLTIRDYSVNTKSCLREMRRT